MRVKVFKIHNLIYRMNKALKTKKKEMNKSELILKLRALSHFIQNIELVSGKV